ncbi:hypothetical protein OFC42_30155, partial [Escherichia coli]|nr:hypothetical protein [Escherichia coli]
SGFVIAYSNKKATSGCQWLGCGNQEWIRTIEPEDIGRLHHPPTYSSVTLRPDRYYPTLAHLINEFRHYHRNSVNVCCKI